jgi:hypothetical protein
MKQGSRYVVAASFIVGSLALAGCGVLGSPKSSNSSVVPVAAQTTSPKVVDAAANKALAADATKVTKAASAQVDGTIVTKAAGVATKVTVGFTGKERWSPSVAGSLTLSGVHVGGQAVAKISMLFTSKAIYLKLPTLSSLLHKEWAEISFSDTTKIGGVDLGQFAGQAQQLAPGQYLSLLASSVNVKPVGTATIDGIATTHYSGTVDLQQALRGVPDVPAIWSTLATSEGVKVAHVNAWIDAGGRPRKVTLALASSALSLTVSLHLSNYGVKVVVTPPAASKTVDLTHGLLGLG